jgi:antitoxin CptB
MLLFSQIKHKVTNVYSKKSPFVEQAFDELPEGEKVVFERLLTCDDPDLFAWFMGHKKCDDPDLAYMVHKVLQRVKV